MNRRSVSLAALPALLFLIAVPSMADVLYNLNTGLDYDVYTTHITGMSGRLVAGTTYYLTLMGAGSSNDGWNAAWDLNNGPASCYEYDVLNSPSSYPCSTYRVGLHAGSNSFTLYSADNGTATPEPVSWMFFGGGLLVGACILRRWPRPKR